MRVGADDASGGRHARDRNAAPVRVVVPLRTEDEWSMEHGAWSIIEHRPYDACGVFAAGGQFATINYQLSTITSIRDQPHAAACAELIVDS